MVGRSVRRKVLRIVLATVCVLGVAGAAPAVADVTRPDASVQTPLGDADLSELEAVDPVLSPDSGSMLELTVRDEVSHTRYVVLSCDPDAGNHPRAREACDQLRAADGEMTALPAENGSCTMEYAPVTVAAQGTWRGGQRSYRGRFDNLCEAVRATGGVLFDF